MLGEKHAAADAQDYERAAELRDTERRLTGGEGRQAARVVGGDPEPDIQLAETVERLERRGRAARQMLDASTASPEAGPSRRIRPRRPEPAEPAAGGGPMRSLLSPPAWRGRPSTAP